jgi:hypothetical protein
VKFVAATQPRLYMAVMGLVFLAIGVTMWVQPQRYSSTPSYGDLLHVAPAREWAVAYLAVAALKAVSIWWHSIKPLLLATHTVSIMLVASWLAAFIYRYATDPNTTIVNVASWSVYLFLLVHSASAIETEPAPQPR